MQNFRFFQIITRKRITSNVSIRELILYQKIPAINSIPSSRCVSTSLIFSKAHKAAAPAAIVPPKDEFVKAAFDEMEKVKGRFIDDLSRHFSLQTDLRVYEDCKVTLPDGKVHKMNLLGRINLKTPEMITISFEDNPSAIKAAKIALQNAAICANPQQDGVVLFVPVPKMTRERREQLAENAKKILNDYKKALNNVYRKYSDKNSTNKVKDVMVRRNTSLLSYKHSFDALGDKLLENKRKEVMKEVA